MTKVRVILLTSHLGIRVYIRSVRDKRFPHLLEWHLPRASYMWNEIDILCFAHPCWAMMNYVGME